MTLSELMRALDDHGATLRLHGDGVKVRAPAPLPGALMDTVRARKAEIVAALQGQAPQAPTALPPIHEARDPHAVPSAPCATCGAVQWRAESRDWRWQWVCEQCRPEGSAEEVASLPPVHDADDPWKKPSAPCSACGQVRWRVWSHDGGTSWQWICNRCRPLVVYNHDGTDWRSDAS
jgi:hypothetical protein